MGTSDSKSLKQEDCRTIEAEHVNFDLPGCLESLTDMAHTGKTQPLKRSSATKRALWGMSRALSAPVTATDRNIDTPNKTNHRRLSLTQTKAVSLDAYTSVTSISSSPIRNRSRGSSPSGRSVPLSTLEEIEVAEITDSMQQMHSNNLLTPSLQQSTVQDLNMLDTLSVQKQRASPSIEVIPPELEHYQHYGDMYIDNEREANYYNEEILDSELHHVIPQLPPLHHHIHESSKSSGGSRLHVPGSTDKHSLLEKRKKLLTKSNRIEEDTPEAFTSNKRHSNQPENDWEQIQEWMVWCIHQNLDDTSEEETSPCVTPIKRGGTLQHQLSDPLRGPSGAYSSSLYGTQPQFADFNIVSSSSPLSRRDQYLPHHQRSISSDYTYHRTAPSTTGFSSTSPKLATSSSKYTSKSNYGNRSPGSAKNINEGNFQSQQQSPVTRRLFNSNQRQGNSSNLLGGLKPKHKSLDNPLFKHSGQSSSFESSGSSRMSSFDSTGTHNDKSF